MESKEQAVEVETVRICVGGQWHIINREYAEELRDTLLKVLPPKGLNHDYELKWLHAARANLEAEVNQLRAELSLARPAAGVPYAGSESNLIDLKRKLEQERARQAGWAHTDPPYSMTNEIVAPFARTTVTGKDGW